MVSALTKNEIKAPRTVLLENINLLTASSESSAGSATPFSPSTGVGRNPATESVSPTGSSAAHPSPAGALAGLDQARMGLAGGAAIAVAAGRIFAAGSRDDVMRACEAGGLVLDDVLDLGGRLVTPGLVDAHTHLLWAGDRAAEFERRVGGASYLEIQAEGGGIMATVRATRSASDEELLAGLLERIEGALDSGATTIEVKTGYGLDPETELRHLELIAEAGRLQPARIVPTFLGAHAIPDEYAGRRTEYVQSVIGDMLPVVASTHPDAFCDVFCDQGAFTLEETAAILSAAAALGLRTKVHADEFVGLGGAALAADIGCTSADHLIRTSPSEMDALARSGTVAVVLPGTTLGLGSCDFADGREMIERGVPVALGSDNNPGTCPSAGLPLVAALAVCYCGLSPAEAFVAMTRNAAAAVGASDVAGQLSVGRPADLTVFEAGSPRDVCYRFGPNPVAAVMIGGAWVKPGIVAGRTG